MGPRGRTYSRGVVGDMGVTPDHRGHGWVSVVGSLSTPSLESDHVPSVGLIRLSRVTLQVVLH